MAFVPGLRKFTFTAHVTSSVGWIGAVLVFLALAAIGLISQDEPTVRGTYLVMAPAAWFVLVPLAHASLLTGIALSLGTTWGLIRHYWVVLKLGITAFCTAILLIYMGTFRQMAGVFPRRAATLSTARTTFFFPWAWESNPSISWRATAASTVAAHVRKSLAVKSSPLISRR